MPYPLIPVDVLPATATIPSEQLVQIQHQPIEKLSDSGPRLPQAVSPAEMPALTSSLGPTSIAVSGAELHNIQAASEQAVDNYVVVSAEVLSTDPVTAYTGLADVVAQNTRPETAAESSASPWQDGGIPAQRLRTDRQRPQGEPPGPGVPVVLQADRQDYDQLNQRVMAEGDVWMQVGNFQLWSERLWLNLPNQYSLAEENVRLTAGEQLLRGDQVTYNIAQGSGTVEQGGGEIFLGTIEEDTAPPLPTDISSDQEFRPRAPQPISDVRSTGGLVFGTETDENRPGNLETGGEVQQLRFEADHIEFDADGWRADAVRLTNDPFSPPELEIRADTARLVPINEFEDELQLSNARIVFDQGFSLPLLRSRFRIQKGEGPPEQFSPLPTGLGIDGRDRDGFFVERSLPPIRLGSAQLSLTPQFLVERSFAGDGITDPASYGLVATARGPIGSRSSFQATANFSGLDLEDVDDRLRANVGTRHPIGDHQLSLDYSFRDRLFNGSLGFQDVQTSAGAVLTSPSIPLGDTGINLSYQSSAQFITAETDQADLLGATGSAQGLIGLFRFQGSAAISRSFSLWRGEALPPTRDQGLRFTPNPIVPYLRFAVGLRGVGTYYTSDDTQVSLRGSLSLRGQVGHFSDSFLDYTRFNITYSRSITGEASSPFLFDRDVDRNTLSGGIVQQIYGPWLLGFQTSINLDTGEEISTDFILEYSRRTYGIVVRINPERDSGFIGFRLSDFTWTGQSEAFGGSDIRSVEGGVVR